MILWMYANRKCLKVVFMVMILYVHYFEVSFNVFELWPLWPWKVGQIENPSDIMWHLTRYTYGINLVILGWSISDILQKEGFQTAPPGGHHWSQNGQKISFWSGFTLGYLHMKLEDSKWNRSWDIALRRFSYSAPWWPKLEPDQAEIWCKCRGCLDIYSHKDRTF